MYSILETLICFLVSLIIIGVILFASYKHYKRANNPVEQVVEIIIEDIIKKETGVSVDIDLETFFPTPIACDNPTVPANQ